MDQIAFLRILLVLYMHFYRDIVLIHVMCLARKHYSENASRRHTSLGKTWSIINKVPDQMKYLREIVNMSDVTCVNHLRMDRNCFARLCELLEAVGGLGNDKFVSVPEKVAIFVSVLAHHKKNVIVKQDFKRSGQTISKYFKQGLKALLRVAPLLSVEPQPIDDTCVTDPWKHFKGCLGALDGTHIEVTVPMGHQGRYRNRKGDLTVNVLAVCNPSMNYIYVLTGWEGSAADSRVLRDAVTREKGLKVRTGNYYLCDGGYMNCEGFLTPYRSTRYHLDEWGAGSSAPRTAREYFNMKHCKARNVIERSFAALKGRWAILRSKSFYPIKIQNIIILSCALLHNYIRLNMEIDPLEAELDDLVVRYGNNDRMLYIDNMEVTHTWTGWQDNLANEMYIRWRG